MGGELPVRAGRHATPGEDTGRLVARVYAANTVGSIIGAVVCSLVLIPGSARVTPSACSSASPRRPVVLPLAPAIASVALLVTPLLAVLLILTMPALPGNLVAHGRYAVTMEDGRAVRR